jgi:hypothetical protein
MYDVLAQPSARGAVGVGEVRHLWRVGTTHHSGEPREDIVTPCIRGSIAPWAPLSTVARRGGPRPPKSPPSPPREMEIVRLGAPPVQECAYHLVVEPKARSALFQAQSGPHEVPLNQTR